MLTLHFSPSFLALHCITSHCRNAMCLFNTFFMCWLPRLLDRDQVDTEESFDDEEDDEFLKGFKVLILLQVQFMRNYFVLIILRLLSL